MALILIHSYSGDHLYDRIAHLVAWLHDREFINQLGVSLCLMNQSYAVSFGLFGQYETQSRPAQRVFIDQIYHSKVITANRCWVSVLHPACSVRMFKKRTWHWY